MMQYSAYFSGPSLRTVVAAAAALIGTLLTQKKKRREEDGPVRPEGVV